MGCCTEGGKLGVAGAEAAESITLSSVAAGSLVHSLAFLKAKSVSEAAVLACPLLPLSALFGFSPQLKEAQEELPAFFSTCI